MQQSELRGRVDWPGGRVKGLLTSIPGYSDLERASMAAVGFGAQCPESLPFDRSSRWARASQSQLAKDEGGCACLGASSLAHGNWWGALVCAAVLLLYKPGERVETRLHGS